MNFFKNVILLIHEFLSNFPMKNMVPIKNNPNLCLIQFKNRTVNLFVFSAVSNHHLYANQKNFNTRLLNFIKIKIVVNNLYVICEFFQPLNFYLDLCYYNHKPKLNVKNSKFILLSIIEMFVVHLKLKT